MSLLGRLEDLSLTDIVQIVFLSRRTGILEIIDDRGRHTVLFRHGLIVNASSPESPDLVSYLEQKQLVEADKAVSLRRMEESGIPYGSAAIEMHMLNKDTLAGAIKARIVDVVTPLLSSREGEFNFILSDSMTPLDIEYEPDVLFKEGGISPQKVLGGNEGEKIKPLKGLEETLKAGKALLRGAAASETPAAALNLGLGQAMAAASEAEPLRAADDVFGDNVLPFPSGDERAPSGTLAEEEPFPEIPEPFPEAGAIAPPSVEPFPMAAAPELGPAPVAPKPPAAQHEPRSGSPAARAAQFKVAGGLFEIESPDAQFRHVILFERNPLVRVAAKRAFARKSLKIEQYGSLDDVRNAMTDLFRTNSLFVTFLELPEGDVQADVLRLMQQLKRKNPRLPVVLIDFEADLRRRHDLLRAGADLYLTKPTAARLQPGLAEEELSLFADELVLFAERTFEQWEQLTGGLGPEAGKRFYEQASRENIDRSFGVLKQLINELSNPNDISEVSATILRLAAEYIDRGALFMAGEREFVGLGGFGPGGAHEVDGRVKLIRIERSEPSILSEVASSGSGHRGKIRKTPANVELMERLGGALPSEVVALPIMHADRAIGILYGDNAGHHAPIDNVTGLEIFLSQAGYAFGNAVFASQRAGRT